MSIAIEDARTDAEEKLSATEQVVAQLWNDVLKTSAVLSPTDNFFELGGDSIGLTIVLFNIQDKFSIELQPEAIYMAVDLRELAAAIDSMLAS
jgi:acyl carrier protein